MNGELILRPYFWPPAIVAVTLAVAAVTGWSAWRGRGGTGGNAGRVVVGVSLVMRLVAVAAVGGLLLGPSTVPAPETEPTRAPLNLLIDASASMQTRDMGRGLASGEEASRYVFGLERWLAADRLAALREHHDVRVYSFDRRPRAVVPDPENADSSQSYVVDSTYRLLTTMPAAEGGGAAEVPDGGVVVVLSDGRDSQRADPQRAASFAEARGIKLHTVTLGRAASRRDLALSATPRQPFLMIDEPGEIGVRLDPIHAGGAETVLRIRHEGEETARPVTLPDRGPRRVTVPVRHGAAGLYTYELSVDPLPGEAEVSNNTRTVFVEVVERRMRVLVLEGQPYWDTKFLAQSLRRDDRVEVTHLTQVTADRPSRTVTRHGRAAAVPAGLEDWAGYDVVVLGRRLENVLSAEAGATLTRYVSERGGRVVFARGRAYGRDSAAGRALGRAWSAIEPVVWDEGYEQDMRLGLTDAGRDHAVFAGLIRAAGADPAGSDLPVLTRAERYRAVKPGTRVLAAAAGRAESDAADRSSAGSGGVVAMAYGRGRVMAVLGQGLWRWELASAQRPSLAGVYGAFWSDAVRWLALGDGAGTGDEVSLSLSGRSVARGRTLTLTVNRRGDAVAQPTRLMVTGPDGRVTQVPLSDSVSEPGRGLGTYLPQVEGVHDVRLEVRRPETAEPADADSAARDRGFFVRETKFSVYDGNTERLQTAADPDLMRALAEGSGGRVLDPGDPGALAEVLAIQRAARLMPSTPRYLWDRGVVMAVLLGWLGVEWLIRKRRGLW